MILDLTEISANYDNTLNFSREIEMENKEVFGSSMIFEKPVLVSGFAKNMSGTIEIFATLKGSFKTECARCGGEAEYSFNINYVNTVGDGEEELRMENNKVDLTDVFYEEIICEKPMCVLCKPSCKGLCPKCGSNLNVTDCGCPSFESDAVWEKLKNLNLKDEV